MDLDLEKILQDLNSMSRMAVIEEAYQTEKMLCNYSKILKYCHIQKEKTVTVSTELAILKMLLEWYETKSNGAFHFSFPNTLDTNSYFIPHYVLISYMDYILIYLKNHSAKSVEIIINLEMQEGCLIIQFVFSGTALLGKVADELEEITDSTAYTSFSASKLRWKKQFGASSILQKRKNEENLILYFKTNTL